MYQIVENYIDELVQEFDLIPSERKEILEKITNYIALKSSDNGSVNLIYICTHNSRRSHFGQIWAHVAADYYHISNVKTFSGGTEATAFNQHAIQALNRVGFKIEQMDVTENPTYHVMHSDEYTPSICFSKVYDHQLNPKENFSAIMTCGDAEENCPFIPGVELRIGTTYEDPKAFDNTAQQDEKYDERCRQIAREAMYVFSKINN